MPKKEILEHINHNLDFALKAKKNKNANQINFLVNKIRDTASSHHRIFFIEVMGRHAGFIAINAALASGAESVLIPEEVPDLNKLVAQIQDQNKGKRSSIIILICQKESNFNFSITIYILFKNFY